MFAGIAAIETPDERDAGGAVERARHRRADDVREPVELRLQRGEAGGRSALSEKTVMGTGPFKFVERVSGSHWVGARFDDYFVPGSLTSTASAST